MSNRQDPSDVVSLSAELHEELDAARGATKRVDLEAAAKQRRIAYFMFFRLVLLALFTIVLLYVAWHSEQDTSGPDLVRYFAIGAGYVLTLVFAWQLRVKRGVLLPAQQLRTIAWTQSAFDVAFATAFVVLNEGVSSDFVFLYLIAILGAATMGDRKQIWVIAGSSALFFLAVSIIQYKQWEALALLASITSPRPDVSELLLAGVRSAGAIGLIATLSAYLNTQLLSSGAEARVLRTLNENILRSLSSGLVTIDQQGTVLFANPTAAQLLGRSGSLNGLDCEEVLPGLRAHLDDSGGLRNRFELPLTRPDDNRESSLGLSCSPLLDEDSQFLGHIVNFQDVTELREMEKVLRRSERLAAVGTLAASVAHEVRNPLAAISGCAELLDTDVSEEDQRLIKVIRSETARLADIVTELLDYTRERKLQRTRIDLAQALLELGESFRADPSNAEIDLIVDVPKRIVSVELDVGQLTQVLWNLVRNGAQAMEGTGKLLIELRDHRADRVEIDVRDYGVGIPGADIERIFEPFFSTKSGGTGIGLALVHRIVDEHGGVITVDSIVGEGTCFTLNMPRKGPSEA